jgi:hypothetical protein
VNDQGVPFRTPFDPENGLHGRRVLGIRPQAIDGFRRKGDQAAFFENGYGGGEARSVRHGRDYREVVLPRIEEDLFKLILLLKGWFPL